MPLKLDTFLAFVPNFQIFPGSEARITAKMVIGGFEHTVLFSLAVGSYNGIGGFRFTMLGEDDTRTDMPTFQTSIVCEHDINLAVVGTFDRLLQALTNPNQFHVTWFAVHTVVFHLQILFG